MADSSNYDVYLVDPGVRASHVITLIQEVTHGSTMECAAMVHDTPARIASFSSRQAAEDLAARFREFDALAIVRRPGETPLEGSGRWQRRIAMARSGQTEGFPCPRHRSSLLSPTAHSSRCTRRTG